MATVSFLKSVYTQVSVIMICKATLYKKKKKKKTAVPFICHHCCF